MSHKAAMDNRFLETILDFDAEGEQENYQHLKTQLQRLSKEQLIKEVLDRQFDLILFSLFFGKLIGRKNVAYTLSFEEIQQLYDTATGSQVIREPE